MSAVSPVLGSSMTVAILCAKAWRMRVGLFVFVASVMGVGLLGSYTVIVVFVWVVMFLLYAVILVMLLRRFPQGFPQAVGLSTGFSTSDPQVGEFSTGFSTGLGVFHMTAVTL